MAATNKSKAQAVDATKVTEVTAKAFQRSMAEQYKAEPLVDVSISPLYAPEFSSVMPVVLNGIRISVPVNGKTYKVPYSYALEIRNRIAAADQKFQRLANMAVVQDQKEQPGGLKLFR